MAAGETTPVEANVSVNYRRVSINYAHYAFVKQDSPRLIVRLDPTGDALPNR